MKPWLQKMSVRLSLAVLAGLLFGWLVSEVTFAASPDRTQREANRVEIVIPAGTAAKLAAGQPVLTISDSMTFMEGDLLIVRNQDSTSHQVGPVWVPAQSSGVYQVGSARDYVVDCSFTTSRKLGLNVQPALTTWTRIQGIISIGLPTGVMLALYIVAAAPKKKDGTEG
jgi:hypothetical protein